MQNTRRFVVVAGIVQALHTLACGGGEALPVQTPAKPEPAAKAAPRSNGPSVSQELGSIDPKAADKVFQGLQPELANCQKAGVSKLDILAGDVKFFVRISHSGKARYAYVEESTLGDRATEKCMIDVLLKGNWPKPEGGDEAEARKSYGFDPGPSREPTAWTSDKVTSVVQKSEAALKKCTAGTSGFKITAYVGPVGDAGKEGRALAVGVAPGNKEAAEHVDCVAEVISGMKFPSPGSYPAKVSFGL